MRAVGDKVLMDMILEGKSTGLIQTLDGSDRPQSMLGLVISVGSNVTDIKAGDYVIAQVAVGSCYKDASGKKYKSADAKQIDAVFGEDEFELAKTFVRI